MRLMKRLALVALAVGATLAVVASAAQAEKYKSESATTFLAGSQTTTNVFTTNGGTVKCKKAEFTGKVEGTEVEQVTIDPTYSECTAFGLAATVTTFNCHLVFTAPTATAGTGWHAVVHIFGTPPTPCVIVIHVTAGACEVKVPEQTVGGVVHIMASGTGSTRDLEFDAALSGIKYESTGGACGSSGTNGTYTGKVTEKGYKDAAHTEQTGIFIS